MAPARLCDYEWLMSREKGWIVSGLLWEPILASIFPNLTSALFVWFCLSSRSFFLLEIKGRERRERDMQITKSCWPNSCRGGGTRIFPHKFSTLCFGMIFSFEATSLEPGSWSLAKPLKVVWQKASFCLLPLLPLLLQFLLCVKTALFEPYGRKQCLASCHSCFPTCFYVSGQRGC